MPIRTIFKTTYPPGVTPVSLNEWIETLSIKEQEEWQLALERQKSYKAEAVADGLMIENNTESLPSYTWKDKEAFQTNKPTDEVWHHYWVRWQKETQAICTMETEEW